MSAGRSWFPLTGPVASPRAAAAAPKKAPIDPLTGPPLALAGRVVTMDDAFTVKADAIVYVDKGRIVAVQERAKPAPAGFAGVALTETGGTLFPGLIELHNHLSYNALPLWTPDPIRRYDHRGQWPDHKDYRRLISGPMTVIGEFRDAQGQPALLPALVRYVECKGLLGGVTTTQGLRLASNAGIQRFYRGIVRNVEQTDETELPEAQGRIPDIEAKDARRFLERLEEEEDSCLLLHLAEGATRSDDPKQIARRNFRALEVDDGRWAINEKFCGIHASGLLAEDFDVMAEQGGSMVWSPLSNLLLYGDTAHVDAARAKGVRIGLGSDWSPTGSKNLLGELKVASLYNEHALGGLFKARDLVAMATRDAAAILKWSQAAGSIAAGKRADLLVIDGTAGDAYDSLIEARETAIRLVMINGVARYGLPELMSSLVPDDQSVKVGGQTRRLFLKQATSDPDVAQVSLRTAAATLKDALHDIGKLAKETEKPKKRKLRALDAPEPPVWSLALDEIRDTGVELRPRLPLDGPRDFTGPERVSRRTKLSAASVTLSQLLADVHVALDPLTVADDAAYLDGISRNTNVPEAIRDDLPSLY